MKYFKDDNGNLRARLRRLEEDNARKSKQIEGLYDNTKVGDGYSRDKGLNIPFSRTGIRDEQERVHRLQRM